jgi:hypothetical protein
MDIKSLRKFLLYSTIINYVLLLTWYLTCLFPHVWAYNLARSGMEISIETFDKSMFLGIVFYKLIIVFFNLIPCIVLYLIKPNNPNANSSV